jgi:release factor glutamine methyltransferase
MVAIGNAGKNNTAVEFLKLDVLDESQWNRLPEYDLVVSNPPYVTQSEKQQMLPNVIENEPHIALFVPDEDPLVFYRSIFSFAKIKLRKTGTLWLEINESFGEEMKDLALEQGFEEVNIIFDFHGKSRFLQCIKLK